ncbi:ParA family protein (plasmid) [Achromobacter seleniivolatilans]|uniref:ParA family protein n=1 Tax=Achromobacter seleniivolatilans TaxID=3047478 RepID=A0ABY9MCU3_9BURK|nr:ParA family protein [Achromobacter sp. R39]WMD23998.1 ParA family protein [Achromobacter sp. R39]
MATKQQTQTPPSETRIIAIYNQKGGCGKTTSAMELGGTIALRGYKTLIADLDPQQTATTWNGQASDEQPFPARVTNLHAMGPRFTNEIQKNVGDFDVIILDCPPAIASPIPWAALQIADLGIIPIIPVLDNVWASKEAKEIGLRAQREFNPSLQLRYLPSLVSRGRLFDHCMKVISDDPDISKFKTSISRRNAFPESQAYGATVHALASKSLAITEIENLATEVLELLGLPQRAGQAATRRKK